MSLMYSSDYRIRIASYNTCVSTLRLRTNTYIDEPGIDTSLTKSSLSAKVCLRLYGSSRSYFARLVHESAFPLEWGNRVMELLQSSPSRYLLHSMTKFYYILLLHSLTLGTYIRYMYVVFNPSPSHPAKCYPPSLTSLSSKATFLRVCEWMGLNM